VDSAGGRWLRLSRGGKPLLQLIVGARASDFQSVYVRRPGDTHVYRWRGGPLRSWTTPSMAGVTSGFASSSRTASSRWTWRAKKTAMP